MSITKQFLFLLLVSLGETDVLQQIGPETLPNIDMNSSAEQVFDTNISSIEILNETFSSENKAGEVNQPEVYFNNNYSEQIEKEPNITTKTFHPGPQYEANWTFLDKETVRLVFSLFSISNSSNEKKFSNPTLNKIHLYTTMVSMPSRSLLTILSLKYYLFTIRQYKTNMEKVLTLQQLIPRKTSIINYEHFSNSLLLIKLNPKEKYSICIYYYQENSSYQIPDLFICQDVMHDHLKHSAHGLLFVLTQYSIIIGILIVLQGLFSMRKRRLAHIVHQHLINKTQRIRSTLSSVSLVRQSFSSMDATSEPPNHLIMNEGYKVKKRIISSPAIVITEPPTNSDENEPFLKSTSTKNHVHFVLGLDEEADDDSECETFTLDNQLNSQIYNEPYDDRSDALLSMAHILDTNKPWSKHNHQTIPV